MTARVRYRVRHETAYAYGSDVVHSHQLLHLVPRPSPFQECGEHSIQISPATYQRHDETDAFGNIVTRVELENAHRRLDVAAEMEVSVHPRPTIAAADTDPWEKVRDSLAYNSGRWPSRDVLEACRFRHESPYVRVKQMFTDYGAECFEPGRAVLDCAEALMQKIHRELAYSPGETSIATPLSEVLKNRRGVCQDFAHLMIACLRSRGLAARYVSGYIRLRPAVPTSDCGEGDPAARAVQPMLASPPQLDWVGAGASHAWVSVCIPPLGWIDLDPTNNVRVGMDHIAIAWGRDFGDVSPLRGVILGGGKHNLTVSVTVEPLEQLA
jgi:transglutaminase-like putative cysteine protease